jgi:phage tail-like protein
MTSPFGGARTHVDDPLTAYNFVVRFTDIAVAGFSEVTGLGVEMEWFDYREGGVNDHVHRLPGPARFPANLVLRRGMTRDLELYSWLESAVLGAIRPVNVSIVVGDSAGADARTWTFVGAYPVKWTGPELRASNAALAIESLELAHAGLLPTAGALA